MGPVGSVSRWNHWNATHERRAASSSRWSPPPAWAPRAGRAPASWSPRAIGVAEGRPPRSARLPPLGDSPEEGARSRRQPRAHGERRRQDGRRLAPSQEVRSVEGARHPSAWGCGRPRIRIATAAEKAGDAIEAGDLVSYAGEGRLEIKEVATPKRDRFAVHMDPLPLRP